MVRVFSALLVLACLSCDSQATPQIGDVLTNEDGSKGYVQGFRLSKEALAALERWRKQRGFLVNSTGNSDGFYAELLIRRNRLYLVKIWVDMPVLKRTPVPLSELFAQTGPVFANWYSGTLFEFEYRQVHRHSGAATREYALKGGELIRTTKASRNKSVEQDVDAQAAAADDSQP